MEGRYNMGTNTLVKEFVGRKDHKDYIKRGTAVENLLVEEGLRRGYTVTPSSEKQNMYDHIDLILTKGDKKFTVDVKARRTGTDKSKGFDDLWTVVEFKNTMGDSGWLYSKSDYIAFERKEDFVFADTRQLRDMCEKIVDVTKRVASFKNANYKVWGRSYQGKKDLISRIEMSKVVALDKTFIWLKNLDNNE